MTNKNVTTLIIFIVYIFGYTLGFLSCFYCVKNVTPIQDNVPVVMLHDPNGHIEIID